VREVPVPVAAVASAPPAPTLSRISIPQHARVAFFGDSWTSGKSASAGNGYARVVGRALGWTVTVVPGGSGTGYVHTYYPERVVYPTRAASLAPIRADLVVLQGGLNDRSVPLVDFATEVKRTAKLLRQKSGNAPIVMIGPAPYTGRTTAALTTIDDQERAVAKQLGIHYISPLRQQWINPTNVASIIDPKTEHPSTVGHAYFGGRVVQALQSIITVRR
jgi:lysophospholipase L1-like esterase